MVPDSESPSESWKVYVKFSVSVVTGFAGLKSTEDADGGLLDGGVPPSGTVIVVSPQVSPPVPPLPFASTAERSNCTEPEPAEGAVQSTLQLR